MDANESHAVTPDEDEGGSFRQWAKGVHPDQQTVPSHVAEVQSAHQRIQSMRATVEQASLEVSPTSVHSGSSEVGHDSRADPGQSGKRAPPDAFDQGTSGQDISNEAQESTTPIQYMNSTQPTTSEGEMKSGRHSPLRSASIGEDFSLPGAASTSVDHLAGDGALAETADAGGSGSDYIGLESIPYGHFDGEFADGPSDRSQGTQPPARPIRREPDLSPTGAEIIAIKKIESIDPDHRYRMLYTNKLGTVWNTRDWDRKNIPDRPCGVSRKELELEKQRFEASEKARSQAAIDAEPKAFTKDVFDWQNPDGEFS